MSLVQFWHLMKTRRLVTLCALLGTLMVSDISVTAEEKPGGIITALNGTMISGYVDTTITWQIQPVRAQNFRGWLRTFFYWFRF